MITFSVGLSARAAEFACHNPTNCATGVPDCRKGCWDSPLEALAPPRQEENHPKLTGNQFFGGHQVIYSLFSDCF